MPHIGREVREMSEREAKVPKIVREKRGCSKREA